LDDAFRDENVLTEADCEAANPSRKRYTVDLKADHAYKIEIVRSDFQAALSVTGADENQTVNDTRNGLARLTLLPRSSGTYTIRIGGLDRLGKYTLAVRKLPPPKAQPVALNDFGEFDIGGILTTDDPPGLQRTPHHRYDLPLDVDRVHQIELASPDFLGHIVLRDEGGKSHHSNSVSQRNVRMIYRPAQAGMATLEVSSNNRPGAYFLTVRRDGCPIPVKDLAEVILPKPLAATDAVKPVPAPLPAGAIGRSITPSDSKLLSDVVWSRDGKAFFVLDESASGTATAIVSLARPKSMSRATPCWSIMIFAGLTSRWTTASW
jgi:hypothetical protein